MSELDIRFFNSSPIVRRAVDGYFDATNTCRIFGKRWPDYRRRPQTVILLEELSKAKGKPVDGTNGLCDYSGRKGVKGTWVCPDVMLDLADWLGDEFCSFIAGWIAGTRQLDLLTSPDQEPPVVEVVPEPEPGPVEVIEAEEVFGDQELSLVQWEDSPSFETRKWQGAPIPRRLDDGYINASAMCRAAGKFWADFYRLGSTQEYLRDLEADMGIPISGSTGLVQTSRGGKDQGTWIHPAVGLQLARWCSVAFAAFMDNWIVSRPQSPMVAQPQNSVGASAKEIMELAESATRILTQIGAMDDVERMRIKNAVNSAMDLGTGCRALPGGTEQSLDDPLVGITTAYEAVTKAHLSESDGIRLGQAAAAEYRKEFRADPPKALQQINGRSCLVNAYPFSWGKKFVGKQLAKHQFLPRPTPKPVLKSSHLQLVSSNA